MNNTQVNEKMKRKGYNKRSDESRPLNDRANILKKIFGSFREAARERMKEDMGVMILRTLPYALYFFSWKKAPGFIGTAGAIRQSRRPSLC